MKRAVLLLAAVACSRAPRHPPAAREAPPVQLAPEDLARAQKGTIQAGPTLSGTLEARDRAIARAELGGAVTAIGPEIGQHVKKGELLARIESKGLGDAARSGEASVAAAQAGLALAKREVDRTRALVAGGAVAAQELDRARSREAAALAQLGQAKAQLATARSQLGDTVVRAPLDGVIAKRSVNAGDVVAPGAELYEVIDPSTMRLSAAVPSDDLSQVATGKPVTFEIHGYPGQTFTGTVTHVAPAADPATRQVALLVDLPNPGDKLVAGLYADGHIAAAAHPALLVPLAAVDTSADQPTVLRVNDGAVERVAVTLGLRDPRSETVEITSGLDDGDVVLLGRVAHGLTAGTHVLLPPG